MGGGSGLVAVARHPALDRKRRDGTMATSKGSEAMKKWKPRTHTGELNKPIRIDHEKWAIRWEDVKGNPVAEMEVDAQRNAEFFQFV